MNYRPNSRNFRGTLHIRHPRIEGLTRRHKVQTAPTLTLDKSTDVTGQKSTGQAAQITLPLVSATRIQIFLPSLTDAALTKAMFSPMMMHPDGERFSTPAEESHDRTFHGHCRSLAGHADARCECPVFFPHSPPHPGSRARRHDWRPPLASRGPRGSQQSRHRLPAAGL